MTPRLVYIAGPYSAATQAQIDENIDAAEEVAAIVAEAGAMPVCPHSLTRSQAIASRQGYAFWIAGTMRLLEQCDAVVLVDGWWNSAGSRGEVAAAHALELPVFDGVWAEPGRGLFNQWVEETTRGGAA